MIDLLCMHIVMNFGMHIVMNLRGAPEVPHYAERRQSLGHQILERWAKINFNNSNLITHVVLFLALVFLCAEQ